MTAKVLAAVEVQNGASILSADPYAIRDRVEKLDVGDVSVQRLWPDRVRIDVEQRKPIALSQEDGEGGAWRVVDQSGRAFAQADLSRYGSLPRVVGKDASKAAGALVAAMEPYPNLADRMEVAYRIGGRRWDVKFKGRTDVVSFPVDARLSEQLEALNLMQAQNRVLDLPATHIDARHPKYIALRPCLAPRRRPETPDTHVVARPAFHRSRPRPRMRTAKLVPKGVDRQQFANVYAGLPPNSDQPTALSEMPISTTTSDTATLAPSRSKFFLPVCRPYASMFSANAFTSSPWMIRMTTKSLPADLGAVRAARAIKSATMRSSLISTPSQFVDSRFLRRFAGSLIHPDSLIPERIQRAIDSGHIQPARHQGAAVRLTALGSPTCQNGSATPGVKPTHSAPLMRFRPQA